jgi:hypothetical protein
MIANLAFAAILRHGLLRSPAQDEAIKKGAGAAGIRTFFVRLGSGSIGTTPSRVFPTWHTESAEPRNSRVQSRRGRNLGRNGLSEFLLLELRGLVGA